MTILGISVPAKVNLHLQVVGKRADGFHELRTIFQSVDICDHLEASAAPEGVLELEVEPVGLNLDGENNLVLRAARALWHYSGRSPGASIRLYKNIPVGGGLGGGSADAAAALILLNRLWNIEIGLERLHELAAGLGSDVPFFLCGGSALGVGRGDEVFPIADLEPYGILVVTPAIEIPTARVFSRVCWDGVWGRTHGSVYAFVVGSRPSIDWSGMVNDLEPIVCDGWPPVAQALEAMRGLQPLRAAVTGSGASVFGVFPSLENAREAARNLDSNYSVEVCRMLTRAEAGLVVRGTGPGFDDAVSERKLEVVRGDN